MSTGRGGSNSGGANGKGNSNNNNGVVSIPTASKKMVQSLKEIVNCPELEIYAMLKECNMDPNEAVNRLLTQDPFHEVKSKREKKKEVKDSTDSRSRSSSNRGGRSGADRYAGRGGVPQFGSSESGASRVKPTYKKDNGATAYAGSLSSAGVMGSNVNRRAPLLSDPPIDSKTFSVHVAEGIPSSRPPSGFQSAWGQASMADIVKMGRPQARAPSTVYLSQQSVSHQHALVPPTSPGPHDLSSSQNYGAIVSERTCESGVSGSQPIPPDDDWPIDEQPPAASMSSAPEIAVDSGPYADSSNLHYDMTNEQLNTQSSEVQFADEAPLDNTHDNFVGASTGSNPNIQGDYSGGTSVFDDDLYKNMNSYQVHRHAYEQQEVGDVSVSLSSVATNLQQLSLAKEDEDSLSEADSPAVKIPDHLQVQSAECSHLSFGSFGSGMNAAFSGPFVTRPVKSDLEEVSAATEAPPVGHSDMRNHDYYEDEQLRPGSDGNIAHRLPANAGNYDMPSVSQPDVVKQEPQEELSRGNQYSFPSSTPSYSFDNNQQLNQLSHTQTTSQMQNLPSLTAYSNALSNTLLASSVQTAREAELSYSAFPMTQSMPTKYSGTMSSISGPTISMTEAMKTGNFSGQAAQTLPGSSVSGGSALPQHLAVHPYSQPLPLGHFANMISYPFMPQSYTYVPSAFQQTFAGNSTYHQSLAAMYKNSVSVSSLPHSGAVASGYGGFGSSTSIPGNFPLNPPAAPAGTSMGYDDILSSQYKDASHMLSLQQQNESSPLWVQGPGSRSISGVPASTYYSFQGHSQQPAGFRQSQQPSQHYGNLGYQNFYHSQSGLSLEHQQQISRDGSLGGSQGQPKQSQQIWQNSY